MMKVSRHAWASISAESIPKREISGPKYMQSFAKLPSKNHTIYQSKRLRKQAYGYQMGKAEGMDELGVWG